MRRYYEIIHIIFIHKEGIYGTCENLGAFASLVKYTKDGIEHEVLMENDEFSITDEIVFDHVEESN